MFSTPTLRRVAMAKMLGLLIGIAAAWSLLTMSSISMSVALGVAGWFLTMGALIGVIGYMTHIPQFNFPLPVWARGGWIGLWMGLILVLLAHAPLAAAFAEITWLPEFLRSPWWFLVDAVLAGMLIDVVVTKVTGPIDWPESGLSDPV